MNIRSVTACFVVLTLVAGCTAPQTMEKVPVEEEETLLSPVPAMLSFSAPTFDRAVDEGAQHDLRNSFDGPVLLLAAAGIKLTPHRTLPPVPALVVHGRADTVVPLEDSVNLASTSDTAELVLVDDDHRLSTIVTDEWMGAWVERLR